MISYAPLDEIIKKPPPMPMKQQLSSAVEPDEPEIETECYYVSVVFIAAVIIISMSDMIKK
jgi:hypothetical protein